MRYVDVKKSAEALERFLELSGGDRRVPLIEQEGRVTIGFEGT